MARKRNSKKVLETVGKSVPYVAAAIAGGIIGRAKWAKYGMASAGKGHKASKEGMTFGAMAGYTAVGMASKLKKVLKK